VTLTTGRLATGEGWQVGTRRSSHAAARLAPPACGSHACMMDNR
jgi:hypothetical protein